MIEVLVWLLISTSGGTNNYGSVTVVERFISKEQCMHVLDNIPYKSFQVANCVQARIAVPK